MSALVLLTGCPSWCTVDHAADLDSVTHWSNETEVPASLRGAEEAATVRLVGTTPEPEDRDLAEGVRS